LVYVILRDLRFERDRGGDECQGAKRFAALGMEDTVEVEGGRIRGMDREDGSISGLGLCQVAGEVAIISVDETVERARLERGSCGRCRLDHDWGVEVSGL
jgi:hypothetical protein